MISVILLFVISHLGHVLTTLVELTKSCDETVGHG